MMRKLWPLAALCLLTAASTHTAHAHSTMSKSIPAEGSKTKPGLATITLGFTHSVRVMLVKVRNLRAKADVKADAKPATTFAASYTFDVEPLAVGDHAVSWTAIAKDGHVMKGTLKFIVSE